MYYFVLALTAYKAVAEAIVDRLGNITIVCQVIKPMLLLPEYKNLNWSHQAILTLLRSAANLFLMQTLGEYHKLKSHMCEKEQCIGNSLHDDVTEEDANKILKWFMKHKVTTSPIPNIDLSPKGTKFQEEILSSFTKNDQDIPKAENKISAVKPRKNSDKT